MSREPAERSRRLPARGIAPTYYPGLDGLRGIAVVAVLLFHGGVAWLPIMRVALAAVSGICGEHAC